MIRSSIDLGTNTCLLLVVDTDPQTQEILEVLDDVCTVVRLGQGVDQTHTLRPDAMARTLSCLATYAERVRELGGEPVQTLCVATSTSRDAHNGAEFYARVKSQTGFNFVVITGEQEGRASFEGALLPQMDAEQTAVIDIGGGSTEFIALANHQIQALSLDIGSVRYTERFLKSDPVRDEEFWAAQAAIDQALIPALEWRKRFTQTETRLLAVAGTATTLASCFLELAQFDAHALDQCTLTRGDLHRLVEELKWRSVREREAMPGMEPKRADVLLAGALILWRSMELLDFSELRVSSRGLRYGVLSQSFT